MSFLLDTDVLSDAAKTRPSAKVNAWIEASQSRLYTSAISIGELSRGIARLPPGRRRADLERWLDGILERMNGRVLAFNTRVAQTWGAMTAESERAGHKMPLADSLIAAIAQRHQLVLATRNTAHFAGCGVQVFNPFD